MAQVVNTIQINGSLEPVFDLVTTTRFWTQWHPATVGVGGVTERPLALADKIRERAIIGGRTYEGNWTAIEHVRPARVALLMETGRIKITYSFQAVGQATEFKRELEFHPEDFSASAADPDTLQKFMHVQSEQALRKLKALVETILQKEAALEIGLTHVESPIPSEPTKPPKGRRSALARRGQGPLVAGSAQPPCGIRR